MPGLNKVTNSITFRFALLPIAKSFLNLEISIIEPQILKLFGFPGQSVFCSVGTSLDPQLMHFTQNEFLVAAAISFQFGFYSLGKNIFDFLGII